MNTIYTLLLVARTQSPEQLWVRAKRSTRERDMLDGTGQQETRYRRGRGLMPFRKYA